MLLVSPGGNILMTCNPTAAHQILRDESYGKPAELLSLLNIFGLLSPAPVARKPAIIGR